MTNIIVEVGASHGIDTLKFVNDKNNMVYAFEPVPQEMMILWSIMQEHDNINLINAAVDIENGWKTFNISSDAAGMYHSASSLLEFRDGIELAEWGRPDFHTIVSIRIPCIRLDSYMEIFNIPHIDFLHIDTQGNDFNVLKSLGERITDVKKGRVEVCFKGKEIYKSQDNYADVVIPWLHERGFTTTMGNLVNVSGVPAEADVFFDR